MAVDLEALRAAGEASLYPNQLKISVGMATCGRAAGALAVYDALREQIEARRLDAILVSTGCLGYCQREPLVDVAAPGRDRLLFGRMTPERARRLADALADGGWPPVGALDATSFYARQHKIVLRNCGLIDPTRPEEYVARDGYRGLARALSDLSPQAVTDEIIRSGLRGRGGGGFPTGRKWQVARDAAGAPKYVICNADEGDPGAYMDRTVLESDPFSVVEGLTIAGYAVGAAEGFIYVREEYPLAYERVSAAVAQARDLGLLGTNILGRGFDFDITIVRGAGAFICGEETALISSIEGGLGEPRPKPPYPATCGLWGRPTVINNVKTLATAPFILLHGADRYRSLGADGNPGTVVFSLVGKVANTGLAEVPLGMPLGELIEEVGGGGARGRRVKAVQTGGPSGGCLPRSLYNLPITYENMAEAGSIMGSGGMVVLDEETCMVDVARFFLGFTMDESCGKCTFCREGTQHLHDILSCIAAGQGRLEDLALLEEVAQGVKAGSLCGLGQTAPNPVLSTLRYFRDEYVAHIVNKRCPAGVCKPLVRARCVNGCPAEVDIPSWLALLAQGRYAEAIEIHRRTNPFVLICSRVCPAFCETRCRRGELDQPAAIRQVKRFMADHELAHPWTPPKLEEAREERVAVVGGGPAGLTAALRLAQRGYGVTIFEKLPVLGGMMAVGIPAYRLPRELLEFEIAGILRAGIGVKTEMALGRDFTLDSLFTDGYRAVVLAIGAHKSRSLGIPGEEKQGVVVGVDFLREVALQQVLGIRYSQSLIPNTQYSLSNKRVGIIGGGDVAVDACRTAWRLGAKEVHLIYRRGRDQMPAYPDQVRAAEEEGVIFHFLTAPVQVLGDGRVAGLECQRQGLGEFDHDGRRRPVPRAETFTLPLDVLIAAIGQETELAGEDGLARYSDGTLAVNEAMATSRAGVFAAGDALTGPATVVDAVAQGNEVARCVDHYLRTGQAERLVTLPGYEVVEQTFDTKQYAEATRPPIAALPPVRRRGNFDEVEQGWDEETALKECRRCLRCDLEWLLEMGLPQESRLERHD